jgi:hypothetical protein
LLRKFLRGAVITSVSLVALVVGLLLARPEALLFYPTPTLASTPDAIGWAYERVEIETEDRETIVGWYLPASPGGNASKVILYCHGNGGNIGDRVPMLAEMRSLGYAVLIFDYRGYGESSGRATVAGTRLDVIAAWQHLVDVRGYDPAQIVLWGRSLGGAVAIDQAARLSELGLPVAALIVESTFTSTVELARELYPYLPVRWVAKKIDYPSRELIAKVDAPILLAHSGADELIGFAHGQRLLEAAQAGRSKRVAFVELTGGHNQGHLAEPEHIAGVAAFLR